VRVICIDFAKAFEKVLHHVIIDACMRFHLPALAIKWITSFLSDRQQCVGINNRFSQWCSVSSGVPQGSVLGPLLFCMVVDDFSTLFPNSMCIKYADDFSILHFVRSAVEDRSQLEWDNVVDWANTRGLPINFNKCAVMNIVTKKNLTLSPIVSCPGNTLESVTRVLLLGVVFSADMKWSDHVNKVVSKASRRLYILCNLAKSRCPPSTILQVYNACIRSILLYAYPVFCNCPVFLQKKLLAIENRAFRIMRQQPDLDILQVADSLCSRLFRSIESVPDHPLRSMFDERAPTPRNSSTLKMPRGHTKRYTSSFIRFSR
jgi:ribonuclease P/MRP protein subunit RPP40